MYTFGDASKLRRSTWSTRLYSTRARQRRTRRPYMRTVLDRCVVGMIDALLNGRYPITPSSGGIEDESERRQACTRTRLVTRLYHELYQRKGSA